MKEQIAIQLFLRSGLLEIQQKNPNYSLRSYASKIGINPGALSAILNGKRNVSRSLAERISRKLLLDPQKRSELLEKWPARKTSKKYLETNKTTDSRYLELEAAQFKMISEWEHYAVLSLMNCKDFRDDIEWIAARLGLNHSRAVKVINRLFEVGLIKINANARLERKISHIRSSDDTVNLSLRKSHEVGLDLAKESLNGDDIHTRDFTHLTMAIDPAKISLAKEMIRKFQDDLAEVMETGNQSEVYRFSTQLIPLTKLNNKPERSK